MQSEVPTEHAGIVAEVQRGGRLTIMLDDRLVPAASSASAPDGTALAPGDGVRVAVRGDRFVVVEVQPRRSKLARARGDASRRSGFAVREAVLAANVDLALVVGSVASPPFHPRLVDRYLVVCGAAGIAPVLVMNKCDLVGERPGVSVYQRLGIPVAWTSAESGEGLADLLEQLRGKLSVLTGPSGVGKTALINGLVGDGRLRVGEVREGDGRGRHTTSSSSLVRLKDDTYVIDTPGIRSLGLWAVDTGAIRSHFPEFDPFAPDCRFRDC